MSKIDLEQEIQFGLENLTKIYTGITLISASNVDSFIKTSALTYECFGYYNAVEHLLLRFIKYLKLARPAGASSHSETLKNFGKLMNEYELDSDGTILRIFLEFMAFRHVATKIYSFLIDEAKLDVIVVKISNEHVQIVKLFGSC